MDCCLPTLWKKIWGVIVNYFSCRALILKRRTGGRKAGYRRFQQAIDSCQPWCTGHAAAVLVREIDIVLYAENLLRRLTWPRRYIHRQYLTDLKIGRMSHLAKPLISMTHPSDFLFRSIPKNKSELSRTILAIVRLTSFLRGSVGVLFCAPVQKNMFLGAL